MEFFLQKAYELALQVDPHCVAPNPRVGCVIVHEGRIVAQGVHSYFGGPHAEAMALKNMPLGLEIALCDVYVTLEPCGLFANKKTPSCAQALAKLKPRSVTVGSLDPKWNGAMIEKLMESGIEAQFVSHAGCAELNPFFEVWSQKKKPYIAVKLALSLDGEMIAPRGKWISNAKSREFVHRLRAQYSSILTTSKTIAEDDPLLNVRLDSFARVFSDPTLIVAGKTLVSPQARIHAVERRMLAYEKADIAGISAFCAHHNLDSVLTECGPTMCAALIEADVVDEIILFYSPNVFGTKKACFLHPVLFSGFEVLRVESFLDDVCVRYIKSRIV
jgi:diaminohydroxyphosphoribosylaminopyrimidine deaminase/5-amino-6-(5-phosphoribosylamino)uracil reductase